MFILGPYSCGNATDSGTGLSEQNGHEFSTEDRDHDACYCNCANSVGGGWWFRNCAYANLNAFYKNVSQNHEQYGHERIIWFAWKKSYEELQKTEMKFRPSHL